MSRQAVQVATATSLGTADTTLYTVPAGKKLEVTELWLNNNAGTAKFWYFRIDTVYWFWKSVPANDSLRIVTFTVLTAGQLLKAHVDTAGQTVTVSGILVDVP